MKGDSIFPIVQVAHIKEELESVKHQSVVTESFQQQLRVISSKVNLIQAKSSCWRGAWLDGEFPKLCPVIIFAINISKFDTPRGVYNDATTYTWQRSEFWNTHFTKFLAM